MELQRNRKTQTKQAKKKQHTRKKNYAIKVNKMSFLYDGYFFLSTPCCCYFCCCCYLDNNKKTAPAPTTTTWKKDFFNWNEHEMDGFYGTASE